MGVRKRGKKGIYMYEFTLFGKKERGSCKTTNYELAQQVEKKHKDQLTRKINRIQPTQKQHPLFSVAFKEWIDNMMDLQKWSFDTTLNGTINCPTHRMHMNSFKNHLEPYFGSMLITEIDDQDLINYQIQRLKEGAAKRTVDIELTTVRQVLKRHKLWLHITEQTEFGKLDNPNDPNVSPVGKNLSNDQIHAVLAACRQSASLAIYDAVMTSIYTGLRNKELRTLTWNQINFATGVLQVGKTKTSAGTGRFVSMNPTLLSILKQRHVDANNPDPSHYVFPSQIYGFNRRTKRMQLIKTFPDRPISNLNRSWYAALKKAGVQCRWHDLRHTCCTRMAEQGAPDDVLMAHFGWMSKKMIRHYAHIRNQFGKHWNDKAFEFLNPIPVTQPEVQVTVQ